MNQGKRKNESGGGARRTKTVKKGRRFEVPEIVLTLCVVALIVVSSFLFGYIAGKGQNRENSPQPEETQKVTVIDDYGRNVTVDAYPERLISIAPSATEVAFSIGLGDKIVGVDDFSDYPPEAKNKTKVGSYNLNYEVIASLNPDIIIAADITSAQQISALEQKGFSVLVLAPKSVSGIPRDIRLLGLLIGMSAEADNVARALEQRISAVTSKTSNSSLYHPGVYLEYYPYWTYGQGSNGNDLILTAGGRNIASNMTVQYPMISNEFVIASNPEIIIYTVGQYTTTTPDEIKGRPGWDNIDAVKNNKIYSVADDWMSRPGPRMVNALEALAHLVHPELFP